MGLRYSGENPKPATSKRVQVFLGFRVSGFWFGVLLSLAQCHEEPVNKPPRKGTATRTGA